MIQKKAILSYILITFGLTLGAIIFARGMGFTLFGKPNILSQLVIAACMFFPAIGAIFTQLLVVKKPMKELGFRFGPWKMYVLAYFLILLMFFVNYTITWLFIQKPDWTLVSFMDQYMSLVPDITLPFPAPMMILLFSSITFIMAPILNIIPSLGEEIGWRGFLLPNLEPLGKTRAMIFSGMIWALWHTPMILILGFGYGSQAWPGVLLHFVTVTGLGIWMGYIWFKTRSTILAGFIHAVFNAHAYGVWTMLFVSDNKLIIGAAGLIGVILCFLLGMMTLFIANKTVPTTPSPWDR